MSNALCRVFHKKGKLTYIVKQTKKQDATNF